MLGAYGEWAASRGGEEPGAFSFRNPAWTSLDAWKAAARARLGDLLLPPAGLAVTDVQVHARHAREGVQVEELSWQLPFGPRTSAFLLKPAGARGRLPAILALHDHGGNKYFGARKIVRLPGRVHPLIERHQQSAYGGVGWANEAAKRGYVVLVPDVFTFGSRAISAADLPASFVERSLRLPVEADDPSRGSAAERAAVTRCIVPPGEPVEAIAAYNALAAQHESTVAKSLFSAGTTWPGITLAEDRAALGYLASRDDVDASRIGCCGLSGGGIRTNVLAGLDDRVRCAVSVGMMTTWRDFLLHVSHTHTWMIYVPGLPPLLDFAEIIGLRVPLPTLVLSTTEDALFTRGETERAAGMLAEVYRKARAPEAFAFHFHPGPHAFDLPMQADAFSWFDRWLA